MIKENAFILIPSCSRQQESLTLCDNLVKLFVLDIFYWKKILSYFFVGHSELDVLCWTNCH